MHEATPLPPRTMFVDHYDIASMTDLERVIHPGDKYRGNPVLLADQTTPDRLPTDIVDKGGPLVHRGMMKLIPCGTVILENGLYRSWHHGNTIGKGENLNLYAESEDGIHWTTSMLRHYEDETGSLENNVYLSRLALRSGDLAPPGVDQDAQVLILRKSSP